jgi:FMN phosphatase YigB (HAD superfamily)
MLKAIIFDFQGTLFDSISALNTGAKELMDFAKANGLKMAGITSGSYEDTILNHLGLKDAMEEIKIVSMSKTPDDFEEVMKSLGTTAEETLVVGDQLSQEIRCGNMLGSTTIFLHKGRAVADSVNVHEHPDHSVKDLKESQAIIEKILVEEKEA